MRKQYWIWCLAVTLCPAVWDTLPIAAAARPRLSVERQPVQAGPLPVALVEAQDAEAAPKSAPVPAPEKAEAARPAAGVVRIDAFRDVRGKAVQLSGTGVLASQTGHIYAPLFVTQGAEILAVSFSDGTRVPARLLGADRQNQLAVLKVSTVPEGVRIPEICAPASQTRGKAVTLVQPGKDARAVAGVVVGEKTAAGPLKNVLEVAVPADVPVTGGVLLDAGGTLVGLALATAESEDGKTQSLYAIPGTRIQESIDRMVRGAEGTEAPKQASLTEA